MDEPFKDDAELVECVENAFNFEDAERYVRTYREQCACQAVLDTVNRLRAKMPPPWLSYELDAIEREAKEGMDHGSR